MGIYNGFRRCESFKEAHWLTCMLHAEENCNAQRPLAILQRPAEITQMLLKDVPKAGDTPRPAVASTSGFISPFQFSPPPKATFDKGRPVTRKTKRCTAEHITSGPYRKRLTDAAEEKRKKEVQKEERAKQRSDKMLQKKKKAAEKPKRKTVKRGKRAATRTPLPESSDSEDDVLSRYISH